MAEPKTRQTPVDARAYLDSVEPERRRDEGFAVLELIERVTGAPGVMWGPTIVGFGSQPYTNTSGTRDWFVIGFSPRKATFTFYGLYNDYGPPEPLLDELGPHTTGKGCLYLKKLEDVDQHVLEKLVRQSWENPLPF